MTQNDAENNNILLNSEINACKFREIRVRSDLG